ncbi:Basic helix-loop-helix DNA-binding superfamily protein, putative isoform 2 [Hibiscus syriacus]|uniref:Basic helix-loop-helix DNA-binding superfamily protein, putative isoform 2 n=1 Tax=Hibiscus syriacus TaxID=106335 RepID=A0A6A3D5I5_HIBSY|nr:Basic helix-loop-helix DNA-binding superfamily protein, putative isoform 2 [Hibiscus syriacus]
MELNEGTAGTGSHKTASESDEVAAPESLQLTDELRLLMSAPVTDNSSSFTALQAVQPIHSPDSAKLIAAPAPAPNVDDFKDSSHFLSNSGLIEQAAKFSVFTGDGAGNINDNNKSNSPEPSSCDSSASLQKPGKSEPEGTESPQPTAAKESSDDAEKLPYVHVEARWGQATDRHISADRATREKINERMKILRDLVPVGSKYFVSFCSKKLSWCAMALGCKRAESSSNIAELGSTRKF